MRSLKLILAAAIAVIAVGCNNGQPREYVIAIDGTPLGSLPPSCFFNNTISSDRIISTNIRGPAAWVIWDGAESKQYLEIGGFSLKLGDADTVNVGSMIEGSDRTFSGQLVAQHLPDNIRPNYTSTKTLSMIITFEDLGTQPKGTIDASSKYTCTNCTNNDGKVAECSAKLNFTSHRIDAANEYDYNL